ncbi:MAG: SH3 domain-containing protein [bacterium]|nr:SH3 domain-containing protein [bacterium]
MNIFSKEKTSKLLVSLILFFCFGSLIYGRNKYIRVIKRKVNIRTKPTIKARSLGYARKGDIFEFYKIIDGWALIFLFSGEERYIHKSAVEKSWPNLRKVRKKTAKDIYNDLWQVELEVATKVIDRHTNSIKRQIEYERAIEDRDKLKVFRKYNVNPVYYHQIMLSEQHP